MSNAMLSWRKSDTEMRSRSSPRPTNVGSGAHKTNGARSKRLHIPWRDVIGGSSSLLISAVMLTLIFGGCCANVYALEAIIKFEPENGTLITFVQFLFVALTSYAAQFDKRRPPFFLSPNKVPIRRWLVNIILFFSINFLNNYAFRYNISVPVHIILRSGGSITTMAAGFLYGKRYSRVQASAVILLSLGISMAAWSDAKEKNANQKVTQHAPGVGLLILLAAQILSSIMGLYTESTYQKYGPQWRENLFFSHALSLPLFLPFASSISQSFRALAQSDLLNLRIPLFTAFIPFQVPTQMLLLIANVFTQYACIRGVNLLAANSSALTVTIVLNIRKLVSLLLSIWLFGNSLSSRTLGSALMVFSAAGLYTLGSGIKSPTKKRNI